MKKRVSLMQGMVTVIVIWLGSSCAIKHTFTEVVDPNEIEEIKKQLVLTVQDMQILFENDHLLNKRIDDMHPIMDPNEEAE